MDKELKSLLMEIVIKVFMKMVNLLVMVNTIGQQVVFSKETLKMALEMGKEFGKEDLETPTNMKASTKKIKKMAMEYLFGQMEIFIEEILKEIRNTVMEKCIGMMEPHIRVNGITIIKLDKQPNMRNLKMKVLSLLIIKRRKKQRM